MKREAHSLKDIYIYIYDKEAITRLFLPPISLANPITLAIPPNVPWPLNLGPVTR